MDKPIPVDAKFGRNQGTTQVSSMVLPAGIVNGDLLLIWLQTSGSASEIIDDVSKGWWRLNNEKFGSRESWLIGRIYNSADAASIYSLNLDVAASVAYISAAIRSHGVTAPGDITQGAFWKRSIIGNTGLIVMPSITTPIADYLALGFTGEATTAADTHTVTDNQGFTEWAFRVQDSVIEQLGLYYKAIAAAGESGSHSVTYSSNTNTNGIGFQIGIPPGATIAPEPVTTGQIGLHMAVGIAEGKITVGLDRLAGNAVEVVLYRNGEEVTRATPAIDSVSGWGNSVFSGLLSNALYSVKFLVDGVEQTDAQINVKTIPPIGIAFSHVAVTGSCQETGSNHPIWDRIREKNPIFIAHQGDAHYVDATTAAAWRGGMEASLSAPKFKAMLQNTLFNWSMDNHDRIITNPTGAGTGLNLGETDPLTASEWKKLAGTSEWATPDTLGRTWVIGRVRYIETDMWSVRDDGDGDPNPRTFLGSSQKQWFKNVLASAPEPLIVWLTQWTTRNNGNGRWNSFPEETSELEAFINARPDLKRRLVLIGGDSHSPQADSGLPNSIRVASNSYRFLGIPSLNISGFDKVGGVNGDGGAVGEWDIINTGLRLSGEATSGWGGYSLITIDDDGQHIRFKWQGVRVDSFGVESVIADFERSFGSPFDQVFVDSIQADSVIVNDSTVWQATKFGKYIV